MQWGTSTRRQVVGSYLSVILSLKPFMDAPLFPLRPNCEALYRYVLRRAVFSSPPTRRWQISHPFYASLSLELDYPYLH